MSSNTSDEELSFYDDEESSENDEDSSEQGEEEYSNADRDLFTAIKIKRFAGVKNALRNGANVNCVNDAYGNTPLMEACYQSCAKSVRILLDAGADPWLTNRTWSAIGIACQIGEVSIVEMLLNHDKELLEIESKHGNTPLLDAICNQAFEVINLLLDRGANAFATNRYGATTLLLACQEAADPEICGGCWPLGFLLKHVTKCNALHCITL